MEKDAGWVLNLERRDGIMNINIISFSVLINEMCSCCTCALSSSFFLFFFLNPVVHISHNLAVGFLSLFLSFGSGFV